MPRAVTSLRQSLPSALPGPVRSVFKALKKWLNARVADHFYFPVWLMFQCLRHRQRAVILFRIGALGDVICTLPMCAEIRKRHPGRLLIYAVMNDYRKMVLLSPAVDRVYGARSWKFIPYLFPGLVEKIYAPQTTDELSPDVGPTNHLIDDLAQSCGLSPADRQPRLNPSPEFINTVKSAYGLAAAPGAKRHWLIGINGGHTWPVKEWDVAKWQQLVNLIHAEYEATILQFGLRRPVGEADEFDQLTGINSLVSRVPADQLVALVAGCDLIISVDSGPVHIAGAVGTPVVGLFGANDPQYRLPPATPGIGLTSQVPCLFCHHRTPRGHWQKGCPHDICCMKELDAPIVFAAVKSMLKKASDASCVKNT